MRASEMIALLQKKIDEHGDLPVRATWYHNEDNTPVEGLEMDDRGPEPYFELFGED
jgi:hypothetical protein